MVLKQHQRLSGSMSQLGANSGTARGPGAAAYHRPVRRLGSASAGDLDPDSSLPGTGRRDPNGVPQPFPMSFR